MSNSTGGGGAAATSLLTTSNPQFVVYAICVTLLGLKMTFIAWHTVYYMVMYEKGMRNPEDLIKGPCNNDPKPEDLKPFEPTERQRRSELFKRVRLLSELF